MSWDAPRQWGKRARAGEAGGRSTEHITAFAANVPVVLHRLALRYIQGACATTGQGLTEGVRLPPPCIIPGVLPRVVPGPHGLWGFHLVGGLRSARG